MTTKMTDHFCQRTMNHIKLFKKYYKRILNLKIGLENANNNWTEHDESKFAEPEYTPYIYITWNYKCKRDNINFKLPKGMQEKANKATIHHVTTNKHHPEYWDENFDGKEMFNLKNRDGIPKKMVDATKMKTQYIAEMIADWCAVSEEKNTNPMDWLSANVNKRWKFTNKQVEIMEFLIKKIWDK